MRQKMLKEQEGTPGYPVYLNRSSSQESPSAERSTSRGESADKEKTHDEQSRAAPEETVPEEIESMKAPPDMKTGRSLRTCLSRVVPADHEARSQVKVKEKSNVAGKKALRGGLTRCVRRIQKRGHARV